MQGIVRKDAASYIARNLQAITNESAPVELKQSFDFESRADREVESLYIAPSLDTHTKRSEADHEQAEFSMRNLRRKEAVAIKATDDDVDDMPFVPRKKQSEPKKDYLSGFMVIKEAPKPQEALKANPVIADPA